MDASRRLARAAVVGLAGLASVAGLLLLQPAPPRPGDRVAYGNPVAADVDAPAADFGAAMPAPDARRLADWIARTRDNHGTAFFMVDKVHATLYVFDHGARLQAVTPVLLGAALGDDSVPDIGARPMDQIQPGERTTPAGRFVAEIGRNLQGEHIVWVDHAAAVSMHRVRTSNPAERRVERLGTATVDDNRISYGCINVPADFYTQHVQSVFETSRTAVVYVLPETRPLQAQFGPTLLVHGKSRATP